MSATAHPGRRLALFTAECCALGPALTEIIERHKGELVVVVTSRVTGGKRQGVVGHTFKHLRTSGAAFLNYLTCMFVLYFGYIAFDRAASRLTGRRRRRYSVAELCELHGIRHVHTDDVNGEDVEEALRTEGVELAVVYWFDQILKENIIGVPSDGVVNVHAAYLPAARGLFPGFWTGARGDGEFGISAHAIENTEIDAGPILAQTRVEVPRERSVLYWDYCVNRAGVELLDSVIAGYDDLRNDRPQPAGGSYFSYPTRAEVREARRAAIRLVKLRDFLAVCRVPPADDVARAGDRPGSPATGSRSPGEAQIDSRDKAAA